MGRHEKGRWKGAARKLVSGVSAAALTVGLMPAMAFAAVDSNGNVSYEMPTQPIAIQKTLKDAAGNEYVQESLSVMLGTPPMQTTYYRMLGISNAGLANDRINDLKTPSTFTDTGLFGSDANVAPDEYLYNYCVSVTNPSANVPDDQMAVEMVTQGRSSYGKAVAVSIDGNDYNMPNEIYTEVNMLTLGTASDKPAVNAAGADQTWGDWVKLENQRANRPKTGEYKPTYITSLAGGGGTYGLVEAIYGMAEQADEIIAANKDANGNYRYASRYVEGPNMVTIAQDFEDISKATEYYVLSKVASGDIELSTVAVVCGYDANSKNFAVRVLNPGVENDKNANVYGGRLASAVNPIAQDITTLNLPTQQEAYQGKVEGALNRNGEELEETQGSTYVRWYSAEQIIQNCDAVFLSDAPTGNGIAAYLAAAADGKQYAPTSEEAVATLTAAQQAAKSANAKKVADICSKYPACMFTNFYAQGCENVMLNFITASYLYPKFFNLTDTMAWWAKNIWHIKDGSLQDIVDTTCYNISLSTNQTQIGAISNGFEETIDGMIDDGNKYYLTHMATVNDIAEGNIKTHSVEGLVERYPTAISDAIAAAEDMSKADVEAAKQAQADAEQKATDAEKKAADAEQKATDAEKKAADAANAQKAAEQAAAAAKQANSAAQATTVTLNKATVKKADIPASATTVILGKKVKKIAKQAFKGSKVTTVIVQSKKLKKAKVKNAFKGSKVATVQVPGSKYKAYKKFLVKKVVGKKVTVL